MLWMYFSGGCCMRGCAAGLWHHGLLPGVHLHAFWKDDDTLDLQFFPVSFGVFCPS